MSSELRGNPVRDRRGRSKQTSSASIFERGQWTGQPADTGCKTFLLFGSGFMRKDVKRSLILWPSSATAIVALIAGYSIVRDFSQNIAPSTDSLALAMQPSFDFAAAITEIELSSRIEHGRRAMEMPQRVASVIGVKSNDLPHHQKIAGVIMPPWGIVFDTTPDRLALDDSDSSDRISGSPRRSISQRSIQDQNRIDPASMLEGILTLNAPASVLPNSNRTLAKPVFSNQHVESLDSNSQRGDGAPSLAAPSLAAVKDPVESTKTTFSVVGWPSTHLLNSQLEQLTSMASGHGLRRHDQLVSASSSSVGIAQWAMEVSAVLQQLQSLSRLGDDQAKPLIGQLESLASQGQTRAENLGDRTLRVQWLQACHSISRRVAVWYPVWELANANSRVENRSKFAIAMKPESFNSVHSAINHVRAMLPESGDVPGWERYLLLNRISEAADSENQQHRMAVAAEFLSRLQRNGLHPAHQQWLQRQEIMSLQSAVRPWMGGVVDYADLLSQIEQQESMSIDQAPADITTAMQILKFVGSPDAERVADSIETHYRNANIRIAISQAMLQRFVPEVPSQSVPVRTTMLGSRVRGTSHIQSDLKVSLTPQPDRWSIQLQTIGQVHTNTTGDRGPVAVRTQGNATFVATTPLEVTPQGITVGQSVASVQGQTTLRGIQTDYDGWPLVGSLVRSAAARRFDSMSSKSTQISNHKIALEIETNVSDQLKQRIDTAKDQLTSAIIGPVNRLRLDPIITDMETTNERLIARYRLAENGQLAAFTPRPRAFNNSLLSVQVHQSAINNTLEQLAPSDQPLPIRSAIANAIGTFYDGDVVIPDDIPEDVTIQFAPSRPISVEFKDDSMWVTLRIVRLQRGDKLNLTKFIVQAVYIPVVDDTTASLVRDGHLRISGPGMSMRERLPIRAIFNKVLSSSRPLPLTPRAISEHPAMEGLVISQLELRDGWIAMAVAESPADRVAAVESQVE